MQHIKVYCKKVEQILQKRMSTKKPVKSKQGLLASSKTEEPTSKGERQQIETIADIVEGIREAREEILNAKK